MTMKPIDQLTPEELRVECAEASNWVRATIGGEAAWWQRDRKPPGMHYENELPNYPADANAALTLAHALAEKGWVYYASNDNGEDGVTFVRQNDDEPADFHTATAAGPHAFELALSRAYLAVVWAGKEQG